LEAYEAAVEQVVDAGRQQQTILANPFFVVVPAMRLTITFRLVRGCPRRFLLMKANRRCSILFHLLVPKTGLRERQSCLRALARGPRFDEAEWDRWVEVAPGVHAGGALAPHRDGNGFVRS